MTVGIYRQIGNDVRALFGAGFTRPVPVLWRANDVEPTPDPVTQALFLRNEIEYGAERTLAFGSGQFQNLKAQFGSVIIRAFAARASLQEDDLLDAIAEAMAALRSQRVLDSLGNTLSFIGDGSGFQENATEDGNWFLRGALMVYEYRFRG